MHTTVIGSKTYRKFTEIKWELLKTRVCFVPFVVDRHVSGRLISRQDAFCLSLCSVLRKNGLKQVFFWSYFNHAYDTLTTRIFYSPAHLSSQHLEVLCRTSQSRNHSIRSECDEDSKSFALTCLCE